MMLYNGDIMKDENKPDWLYSNGLPYYPSHIIPRLVDKIILRRNNHKPNLIVIDGVSSSGKTTLAVHLADEINKRLGLPPISLDKDNHLQIGIGASDFLNNLTLCKKERLPVIIYDEAGEYNKRGWISKLNKVLDGVFDTFRAYDIAIIMVLHDFSELPKHIFGVRIINTLIHTTERKSNYGVAKFYSHKRIYWLLKYKKEVVYPEDAYRKEHYNCKIIFKNLSPDRAKSLDILCTEHKFNKLAKSVFDVEGLVSMKDICDKVGRSYFWVFFNIRRLKIKPVKKYNNKNYYDGSVVDKLYELI